jgi:P4 family phage/plasmid primase-like protien
MRNFRISIGKGHNAKIRKTATCSFPAFCDSLLAKVPETEDKASNGWVCPAAFDPEYRDSENFIERNLLSFDYDHVEPADLPAILDCYKKYTYLAFTTWSHTPEKPRLRVWLPVSRPMTYDEFQAISRRVADEYGIEKMARESHTPSQYYFRPTIKPFEELQSWRNDTSWVDADEVLATYENWTDRSQWPHRAEGDGVHNEGASVDPRTKPGIVGAFCRAYTISEAIEKFDLPYKPGSSEGRWTYTDGSRPDGAIGYDEDTKLHSHHDTDPARGQCNAYDLVRNHRYGGLDRLSEGVALRDKESSKAMDLFARSIPEIQAQLVADEKFDDLDATDTSWLDAEPVEPSVQTASGLPARIREASSKLTDQENARRVQRRHGNKLLAIGKTFYCWTGTHWEKDNTDTQTNKWISELSKIVHAEGVTIGAAAEKEGRELTDDEEHMQKSFFGWARECGNHAKWTSCAKILGSLLGFDATRLNTDPDLFSCANGTLNLQTGVLRPHAPEDFITACSRIAYDPAAQAPRFQQFLREIHQGDDEIIAFVQRWFGYCMTGHTNEHVVVFHVGQGGNGKGTTMGVLSDVLGSGYYSAANQNLLALEENGATPEIANLLGKRMVTISETDENMEIRDGLVKKLTGGDRLSGRHLFKDPFEFVPTHKLQIFTNHAPAVKSQDFSMWRRIILLNYHVRYGEPAQVVSGEATSLKDRFLDGALKAEAPGILRWLVDGAREWARTGLKAPASVLAATQKYREDQDTIGAFARERLVGDPEAWIPLSGHVGAVYQAYKGWLADAGGRPLGRNRFMRELQRVMPGAKLQSQNGIAGFNGIKLTSDGFLD